ncbi:Uncharacterised protein [uncultured archaeon]|nr:Uncharacterised protein [uncultured archaeon]
MGHRGFWKRKNLRRYKHGNSISGQVESQSLWERLKIKYPKIYVFVNIMIWVLPIGAYSIRPYADYFINPEPRLEYNLAGDASILGHISPYRLWIEDETKTLIPGQKSIIDIQVQNRYDQPLLTDYDFTKIDDIIINTSYNRQSGDNPIAINSHEWNHFYLDVYVNESAKEGNYTFCFTVKEAIKNREMNYQTECSTFNISLKPINIQQ